MWVAPRKRTKKEIVNNCEIPGGLGGLGVRLACKIVQESPGIPQQVLLKEVLEFVPLHASTAGWIVSASSDPRISAHPGEKLWERKKEKPREEFGGSRKVYCCYPNKFTKQVSDSFQKVLTDVNDSCYNSAIGELKFLPQPGDIVLFKNWRNEEEKVGTWVCHTVRIPAQKAFHQVKDIEGFHKLHREKNVIDYSLHAQVFSETMVNVRYRDISKFDVQGGKK